MIARIGSLLLLLFLGGATAAEGAEMKSGEMPRYALAIHGGAGTILRDQMTTEREDAYRAALAEALAAGETVLAGGGDALDAVEAAIVSMEDSALFNAGKGAVFTYEETNELDASIMDGRDLSAGAVAAVGRIRNPIRLARLIMQESKHVMLSGEGAEAFARHHGMDLVDADYFRTDFRLEQLRRAQEKDGAYLDHDLDGGGTGARWGEENLGTVGAVALDERGNLAAGTSTGGMTNKRWNRIGDSPIIGAGTYADNRSCAVSGTGHGEYFIRATVARTICARMEFSGDSLEQAAHAVIMEQLPAMGGDGGVIALDGHGNVVLTFNTPGMYRASVRAGEEPVIGIYRE